MTRSTIDFGIDLGTTNSAIAVLKGRDTEVFKNNEGFEYTPSAVWIDKKQQLHVGKRAKDRLENDPQNARSEFKLLMGTTTPQLFEHSHRAMLPEELSAEVLKSLRGDVKQRMGEDVEHAVITVPAAFEFAQCEATRKAAQLAGLQSAPLLQEPVAAALAYGFQKSESDKVYWLVYDFGGGTFDAALMHVSEGIIQVANHGGDNQLGGKLVDWEIVDRLLIPAVASMHNLKDFRRGNPKWVAAISKLKQKAEEAKITLSRDASTEILIETLCLNDAGESVGFEHELKRADVEGVLESYVRRSITICKRVLSERNLVPSNIEKLVLVGGPTLTPHLRDMLSDKNEGLGIPLDFSLDPLTIVARGAAIFAGTQRIEGIARNAAAAGSFGVQLKYNPVGTDPNPQVAGKILPPAGEEMSFAGYTIEFDHPQLQPPWRSGKIQLNGAGTFMTELVAAPKVENRYSIELTNPTGTRLPTVPDSLAYTFGVGLHEQSLIHSLGFVLSDNKVAWLLKKGVGLPARKRDDQVRRTTTALKAGQAGAPPVRIVIIEGDKDRADRNKHVGALEISATQIKRDLPAGSEVEVSLEIDASRLIRAKAYIPLLDEEYELKINYTKEAPDLTMLGEEFAAEKTRLSVLTAKAETMDEAGSLALLKRLRDERVIEDITTSLAAAATDPNAATVAENRLLDFRNLTDELEDLLDWPTLVARAREQVDFTQRRLQRQIGSSVEQSQFDQMEREIEDAITQKKTDVLRRKFGQLCELGDQLRFRDPEWWIGQFEWIREHGQDQMSDSGLATALFAQGYRSLNENNLDGLKQVVRQLWTLLPEEAEAQIREQFRANIR